MHKCHVIYNFCLIAMFLKKYRKYRISNCKSNCETKVNEFKCHGIYNFESVESDQRNVRLEGIF